MATIAPNEDAFVSTLRQAGAVFAEHDGRLVAVNYGSTAGELAVCLRSVGLVDRSELTKLVVDAPPERMSPLLQRCAGTDLAVGGVTRQSMIWWCRAGTERTIALCARERGQRLLEDLRLQGRRYGSLTIDDVSRTWTAFELIGPAVPKLLRALGAYGDSGDPQQVAPFSRSPIGPVEVSWLLGSSRSSLALVARDEAAAVWRALEDAGRPFSISCVGQQAAAQYALLHGRA